ncbi:MAG: hypothetical protein KatS3mg087_1807 [Patescibacteria group bacterium]|nr:MAG: hypothetical protein KatS3mg087_1807 [Patescibacteria group bacterium]
MMVRETLASALLASNVHPIRMVSSIFDAADMRRDSHFISVAIPATTIEMPLANPRNTFLATPITRLISSTMPLMRSSPERLNPVTILPKIPAPWRIALAIPPPEKIDWKTPDICATTDGNLSIAFAIELMVTSTDASALM